MRTGLEIALVCAAVAGCSSSSNSGAQGALSADAGSRDAGVHHGMPHPPPKEGGTTIVKPEAGVPACGGTGALCNANSDCCTKAGLSCEGFGMCCAPGLAGSQVICGADSDCCSGHCGTASDGVQQACCSESHRACYEDGDCCYGLTCNQGLGVGGTTCCAAIGSKCGPSAECCPGTKCGTGCVSLGGGGCAVTPNLCCIPAGQGCLTDSDCCEPEGSGGGTQCYGLVCCFSIGSPCKTDDECCGGTCTDNLCD